MKRTILSLVCLTLLLGNLQAQTKDPQLITGQLENGLTYYIKANKFKENRADFYIVQKVGSMQEEEAQRGLAHFLEHMAFDGTTHFPKNEKGIGIQDYLETIGVKFGVNLNAYTGFDETVYNINDVPTNVKGAADSALLILADWSHSLLLREPDIDKQRKIIHEEWRTRRDVSSRMIDSLAPVIFHGSKYAERMPIGLMSVVQNFDRQTLVDYYHKWYRPDLQGIIVVGDIDPAAMESKLKEYFAGFPKVENPAKRVYERIPDNDEPLVGIAADKEMSSTNILYIVKRDPLAKEVKESQIYPLLQYCMSAVKMMFNNRLAELTEQANPPFALAMAQSGPFFGTQGKDAFQIIAIAKPGESKKAMQTIIEEYERAKRFGFTQSELEVAKKNILSFAEKRKNEKDKLPNNFFVSQYKEHFLTHEPIIGVEEEYNMLQEITAMVGITEINKMVQGGFFSEKNHVMAIMTTLEDKPTVPSEEEIKQMMLTAKDLKLEPYKEEVITEPLLSEVPKAGKVVEEKKEGDTYIWTLSNGVKVYFQPTDFKDDEILLVAKAHGGQSESYKELGVADYKFFTELYDVGGLGKHKQTNLEKVLSGKNVGVKLSIGQYERVLSANSGKKDLETMMQLLYLYMTDVRKDNEAFQSNVQRFKGFLANALNNPSMVYRDSLQRVLYLNDPRFFNATPEDLDAVDYDKLLKAYRKAVKNAADYTYFIAGSTDAATLKPLVETYIAALPAGDQMEKPSLYEVPTRKGVYVLHFDKEMDTHKSTTTIVQSAELPYTAENILKLQLLKSVLDMEFIEEIREKLGGTYGVSVGMQLKELPRPEYLLFFQFDCDVERRPALVKRMNEVVDELQEKGPKQEYLDKTKKYLLKTFQDGKKINSKLLSRLEWKYIYHYDQDKEYEKLLESMDAETIKQFAKTFFGQKNRIEVSMSDPLKK